MHRMMEIVAPLRIQPETSPARGRENALAGGDQGGVVEVRLGDQRQGPAQIRAQRTGLLRHLLENVSVGCIDESVHRIEPQPVDVVVAQPHRDVVENVAAHLRLVEVDRRTPGVRALRVHDGCQLRQVVAARSQVVVDDVLDDRETARMAGIDEPLIRRRPPVGLIDGVPEHAVVAPIVRAVEAVDGQHLDEIDAQGDQVVEFVDRAVEGAVGGECADVQLVDHAAGELPSGPAGIRPGERGRIEGHRPTVYAFGLTPRSRIGNRGLVVIDHEAVGSVDVGSYGGGPPSVSHFAHRMPDPGDLDREGLRPRCPHLVAHAVTVPDLSRSVDSSRSVGTSRATG